MIVSHIATPRAFSSTPRGLVIIVLLLSIILNPLTSRAHSPFDSSAHVIVMEQQLEATVTVGTGLAAQLLKDSGQSIPTTGVGTGKILPLEFANRFFEIEANGQNLPATQLRVLSDGLEALFVVTYTRPTGDTFRLRAQFAKQLPAANFCALVVTDDNNQTLSSHIVKLGSETTDVNLPKLPGAIVATTTPAPVVTRISASAEPIITPLPTVPSQPRWRFGVLIILAAVVALGGWWLVQKTFRREQN